jgi:hypothetical protein
LTVTDPDNLAEPLSELGGPAGLTMRLKVFVALPTQTWTEETPGVVGVPDNTPTELSVMPAGTPLLNHDPAQPV